MLGTGKTLALASHLSQTLMSFYMNDVAVGLTSRIPSTRVPLRNFILGD